MMIPEGRYQCRATEGLLSETEGGNPQVAVDIVIIEEGEWEGQHRTWYGSFTEKSTDRTLQSLRLLGWRGDDLSELVGLGETEAYVTITHEEDQEGNLRDRAAWINSGAGIAVKKPMNADSAKAFAERMKGHVLSHNAKTGGSPNATKPAAPSGGSKKRNAATKPKGGSADDFKPEDGDQIPF